MKYFIAIVLFSLSLSAKATPEDQKNIEAMLTKFLAQNSQLKIHDEFWADDLVYTSSTGARFGKNEIINSFSQNAAQLNDSPITYSAENIDIRIYPQMAVLAFKLVANAPKVTASSPQTIPQLFS